jgi:hypothetical protein
METAIMALFTKEILMERVFTNGKMVVYTKVSS